MNAELFDAYIWTIDSVADEPDCDDPDARSKLLKACTCVVSQVSDSTTWWMRLLKLKMNHTEDILNMVMGL